MPDDKMGTYYDVINVEHALENGKKHELQLRQEEALCTLANSVKQIAEFITSGGLSQLLSGYSRTQAIGDIIAGLAAHDGRNALDARTMAQNATEIVHQVEAVYDAYRNRGKAEERDPELKDGEADLNELSYRQHLEKKRMEKNGTSTSES